MDYRAAAIEAAKRNGVDPNLFLRLVGQESAFKPGAVSPKGATGLGQLMPATARELGVDPTDPLQNLEGSARYFRQQMDTFGNPALALAAYNAGPGAVKKYGGIPPYRETQNYVAKILGANAPQTIAADTMRALGIQPRASTKGGQPMAGLLGMGAMEEQKAPGFWDKFAGGALSDEDTRAKIAMWMQGMTMRPNQALVESLQRGIERRGAERQLTAQANKTAAWLRAQGREDLAAAVEQGIIGGKDAASIFYTPEKTDQTALMQNYEYALAQGMTPEEARTWVSSGTSVNVDLGEKAGAKFAEQFAAGDAKTISDVYTAGLGAARNLGRLDELQTRLASAPAGATGAIKSVLGEFGIATEGLDDIQAATALINSMVPEQRQPGSGPMSDADLALFKQSLPRIINQPGGNQLIIDALRRINQYDAEGAQIVQELRAGNIDRAEAFNRLMNRQHPLAGLNLTGGAAPTTGATGAAGGTSGGISWRVIE